MSCPTHVHIGTLFLILSNQMPLIEFYDVNGINTKLLKEMHLTHETDTSLKPKALFVSK